MAASAERQKKKTTASFSFQCSHPFFLLSTTQTNNQFDLISSSVSTLPYENREQVRETEELREEREREKRKRKSIDGDGDGDDDKRQRLFPLNISSLSPSPTSTITPPPLKQNRSARSPSTPRGASCSPSTDREGGSCSSCAGAALVRA